MPSALVIIFALVGIGYILTQAGGGFVDTITSEGPNSGSAIVDALAVGIAHAEGFYTPLSRPARNHNPGDISDSYLAVGRDSGGLSIFNSDQDGWNALTHKLSNILAGTSGVYPSTWSIYQLASKWTGGDAINGNGSTANWAATVAGRLNSIGVNADPNTALNKLTVA